MKATYLKDQLLQFGKISLLAIALCGSKLAFSGDRGGNGGETITKDGIEQLKDLVSSSKCEWYSTHDFISDNIKDYSVVESYFQRVHKELGKAFKQQAVTTTVCLTDEKLVNVDTSDPQTLFVDHDKNGNQIAIRLNDHIFINGPLFNQMSEDHKKYLALHEMLHGLMGKKTIDFRYLKVRSFISNVKKLIDTNDLRESRLAILIKNTIDQFPIFSGEKSCGVFNEKIVTTESAIEDCLKLYGPYSYLNSNEPNVVGGIGNKRYTETSFSTYRAGQENQGYDNAWLGDNVLERNILDSLGIKTLPDYLDYRQKLNEYNALESAGTLTVDDCIRLGKVDCRLIQDNFFKLSLPQYEKLKKQDPNLGCIFLNKTKTLSNEEELINASRTLKSIGGCISPKYDSQQFYNVLSKIPYTDVEKRLNSMTEIGFGKSSDDFLTILRLGGFSEKTCVLTGLWSGVGGSTCKQLKRKLLRNFYFSKDEKSYLRRNLF